MAEGSFSSAPHSCFQKLFTQCGLQHKGVFGHYSDSSAGRRATNVTAQTRNSLSNGQHEE